MRDCGPMNVKLLKTGLVLSVATALVIACGSDPKPEPVTPPPTPSAPAVDAAAPATSSAATPAPVDAGPKTDPKVAECAAIQDDANQALDAERIAVDKDCKKDADCVGIKGRACGFNCVTGAIPKALEKDWNAVVTKVKDNQCKKYDANECIKYKAVQTPDCKDRKIACEKSRCVLKDK